MVQKTSLSLTFSSYLVIIFLVLSILAFIASLLYSRNRKIFFIVLLITGVLPILITKSLFINFSILLVVAGIIGVVSFIKEGQNQSVKSSKFIINFKLFTLNFSFIHSIFL
jgi:hypothetical protein